MPNVQPKGASPRPAEAGSVSGLRVSLMPAESEGRRPPDLGRSVVMLVIIMLVETLVIGGVYFFLAQSSSARSKAQTDLRQKVQEADAAIAADEAGSQGLVRFSGRAAAVAEALDGHIYWQKFFAFLEANTTPTVRYVNFSGDALAGQVILDALAVSYRDMAEQIVILREHPMVESVRATSAAARINEIGEVVGVGFSMAVSFKPELMLGAPTAE